MTQDSAFPVPPVAMNVATRPEDRSGESQLPDLMVRYQQGDSVAVEELIRWLSPYLMRFFAAAGGGTGEAEDLFQECWIRIHRSRHTYRPSEPLLPWIFAIARHTKLDGWRRRRRRESREVLMESLPDAPSSEKEAAAPNENFERLLKYLPDSQREVILMLKVSGMSLEDVARATSSTVGAIKQKAHRAYATLRGILEKEGSSQCQQK